MNREQKIKAIYEKIADKTLSFGCRVKLYYELEESNPETTIIDSNIEILKNGQVNVLNWAETLSVYKIIGHPVMIGDVLDYIYKNLEEYLNLTIKETLTYWEELRKPLEDQSDLTISYIYNIIQK